MVDLKTGKRASGPALSGAGQSIAIRSMTISQKGELLGVVANPSSASRAALVTIDAETGAWKTIGDLPLDTAALAFAPYAAAAATTQSAIRRYGLLIAIVIGGVALAVLAFRWIVNTLVPD